MKRPILFLCIVSVFVSCMITVASAREPIGNDHMKSWRQMANLSSFIVEPVEEDSSVIETNEEPKQEPTILPDPSYADMCALARLLYGECRGVPSKTRQAAVAWTVFNRVDDPRFPNSIMGVITQRSQFSGYRTSFPVTDELYNLSVDVWYRWQSEKTGQSYVGRVLPKEYCYFIGNGRENIFRTKWNGGSVWNWSLESPYST